MHNKRRLLFGSAFPPFLLVLSVLIFVAAKAGNVTSDETRRPQVYTVNYPLYAMAQFIGGEFADIHLPKLLGDPAFWEPDIETILAYQQADLIVLNGANYAKWIGMVSLPEERTVITSQSFEDRLIREEGPSHNHGPTGDHSHSGIAFTTWLDMQQAEIQARTIRDALTKFLPEHQIEIDENFGVLQDRLTNFGKRLQHAGTLLAGQPILYSHPVYQYLERAYGLNGLAVQWEPDNFPDVAAWRQLTEILRDHPAKVMLWEEQPSDAIGERLEELNVDVIVFSQMPNRPQTGDFLSGMAENISRLEQYGNR